jgi:hypothetical protein
MGRTRKYLYCDKHRRALHKCRECSSKCFPNIVIPSSGKCRAHTKRLIECLPCSEALYEQAERQKNHQTNGYLNVDCWVADLPPGAAGLPSADFSFPLLEDTDDELLQSFQLIEEQLPGQIPHHVPPPPLELPPDIGLPASKRPRITRGELKGTLCANLSLAEYEALVAQLLELNVNYTVYERSK